MIPIRSGGNRNGTTVMELTILWGDSERPERNLPKGIPIATLSSALNTAIAAVFSSS
jgi:hypothetical protein